MTPLTPPYLYIPASESYFLVPELEEKEGKQMSGFYI